MSEERDYNEELEAIFGKSTDLRVAYKDLLAINLLASPMGLIFRGFP